MTVYAFKQINLLQHCRSLRAPPPLPSPHPLPPLTCRKQRGHYRVNLEITFPMRPLGFPWAIFISKITFSCQFSQSFSDAVTSNTRSRNHVCHMKCQCQPECTMGNNKKNEMNGDKAWKIRYIVIEKMLPQTIGMS